MHAQGAYQSALPDIKGRAVVALAYKFQPAPQGRQQVVTTLTSFVQIDSAVIRAIGRMGGSLVQKKADREARQLLRVFSKVSRAIEDNPADVYARVREHAGRAEAGAGGVPEAAARAVAGAPGSRQRTPSVW